MKSRAFLSTLTFRLIALTTPVWLVAQQSHTRYHHYAVIDLGTLGGPNSDFVFLGTQVLNNRGNAVGGADTSILDPNYPNVNPLMEFPGFGIRPFLRHGFKWQQGVLTDLGALPGNNNSDANWVNATGEIVGGSGNNSIDPLTGFPEVVAVAWKDGRIKQSWYARRI